jgi:phosphatidylglycerol:prolipoprotein diacylglycerol transferase
MTNPSWINPVIFQIGPIALHWYGLMYALTFILGYLIIQNSSMGKKLPLTVGQKDNLLIEIILGIILGGRIGYVLIYNLPYYWANPLKILAIWEGGLSFHGGLIGAVLAIWIFARQHKMNLFQITDLVVFIAPIGILLGRIGNFINGELYGRISDSFCVHFPTDPANCRYPSQLFEAATEGLLTFIILYCLNLRFPNKKHGFISASFMIIYSLARISMEFFREPDPQIGFLLGGITVGQILSAVLLIAGIIMFIMVNPRQTQNSK